MHSSSSNVKQTGIRLTPQRWSNYAQSGLARFGRRHCCAAKSRTHSAFTYVSTLPAAHTSQGEPKTEAKRRGPARKPAAETNKQHRYKKHQYDNLPRVICSRDQATVHGWANFGTWDRWCGRWYHSHTPYSIHFAHVQPPCWLDVCSYYSR